MTEKLIRKFVEKLDYSYNYKTVNERQNIINEICEIAGIEQLTIPDVVRQSEQYCDWCSSTKEVEVLICKKCRQGMDRHR